MELPIEFSKCPNCNSKDTICRLACANDPSIPKGTFVSLEKTVTPIQDANRFTIPAVKAILVHYDVCAKCGTRYCTRAEMVSVPVTIQGQPGQKLKFAR